MCANPESLRAELEQLSLIELDMTVSYAAKLRRRERGEERAALIIGAIVAACIVASIWLDAAGSPVALSLAIAAASVGLIGFIFPKWREWRHDRIVSDDLINIANAVIASKEGR